jgi:predicted ATPase
MARINVIKHAVPRIEYLRVKNYRALQDLELKDLKPLTVFLGPNGSGKSTLFDVFAFGTLKMLAYLTVLHDPDPPQLIGIEEPENHLHPRPLPGLAEECRNVSKRQIGRTQLMITTHYPLFVSGLRQNELWVSYHDNRGFTQARRASDIKGDRRDDGGWRNARSTLDGGIF